MGGVDRLVRGLLSRRDPEGFYVVPARREALRLLDGFEGIVFEEAGDTVFVRARSRRVAEKVARLLARRGLLAV